MHEMGPQLSSIIAKFEHNSVPVSTNSFMVPFQRLHRKFHCLIINVTIIKSRLGVFLCRTYLYFFHDLFAEGADFGGAGNCHIFAGLVLASDAVERFGIVQKIRVDISLGRNI